MEIGDYFAHQQPAQVSLLAESVGNSVHTYSEWQIEWQLMQIADLVCSVPNQ